MTPEQRMEYVLAVWEAFLMKAGSTRLMSSLEYALIVNWADAGIPLRIVLRALQDFNGKPRRLEALRVPVEEATRYWREALA